MPTFILFESALGYALFQRNEMEEIALSKLQQTILDYSKFSSMVKYVSFVPFETPEHGLENINNISEGILHQFLAKFLEMNLGKIPKVQLGILEPKLGGAIQELLKNVTCFTDDSVFELVRGIRMHFHHFVKGVKKDDIEKAQLGLSHAYSRAKIKFNVNKADNMIIQAISMLDQLDKDLNTFSMRIREWYSWHFPELNKLIKDNLMFARLVLLIKDRSSLSEESLNALTEITKDEDLSKQILNLANSSMGFETSEYDMINIELFANKVVSLSEYQEDLTHYLQSKMHDVAPNLTCILGEKVGARLISKAGSLINLAKFPASTLQILGAEKALFRALKTRSNTPKYGLIFNSSFISKASKKNKGKISRYLANKCSAAVRIDSFQDHPTSKFGEMLRNQVEERLQFYENGGKGVALKKNIELMREIQKQVQQEQEEGSSATKRKREAEKEEKQPKKKKAKKDDVESDSDVEMAESIKTPSKKEKKKAKKDGEKSPAKTPAPKSETEETKTPKSSKKEKKKEKKDEDESSVKTPEPKTPKSSKKKEKKDEDESNAKTPEPKTPKSSKKEKKDGDENSVKMPETKTPKSSKKEKEKEKKDEDESSVKTPKSSKKKEKKDEDESSVKTPEPKTPKSSKKKEKKDEDESNAKTPEPKSVKSSKKEKKKSKTPETKTPKSSKKEKKSGKQE